MRSAGAALKLVSRKQKEAKGEAAKRSTSTVTQVADMVMVTRTRTETDIVDIDTTTNQGDIERVTATTRTNDDIDIIAKGGTAELGAVVEAGADLRTIQADIDIESVMTTAAGQEALHPEKTASIETKTPATTRHRIGTGAATGTVTVITVLLAIDLIETKETEPAIILAFQGFTCAAITWLFAPPPSFQHMET